ncbi:MAG: 3-isopropylmalate dehydrogenase [Anaerolineae bacterium]|nr:3-isopropylmalate dehydrogenase [Anaerolineae bacterium]
MEAKIILLPGDGIGPEVVTEGVKVLETIAEQYGHSFTFEKHLIGGCAIDESGTALSDETVEACRTADAILLGAVGGPKWDDPTASVRPEQGLLRLRYDLGLFANLRPVTIYPQLMDASPLKRDRLEGVDILVVRELTGGVYFGKPRLREEFDGGIRALDTMVYTDSEVRRVVRLAFKLAQGRSKKKVTSVDKANVLESSRLWRQVAGEVAGEFPDIEFENQLVDSATMRLIQWPASLDVVVTTNMFGDILTDEASVLSGSMGLLPSASLAEGSLGLYEPIHGSAPDIAGKGIANPIGTILSVAMLLRHSLGLEAEASAIEQAIEKTLEAGVFTKDLGGDTSTRSMGEAICARL